MPVEVAVDQDRCIGSGDCARLAPLAFRIDDREGISMPLASAADVDLPLLLRAARSCPTQSIRIVRDGEVLHASR